MISVFESWRNHAFVVCGWRRVFLVFLLGALSTLALPPVHFIPALIPSFVGLIWLLDGSAKKSGEKTGYHLKNFSVNGPFATGWWFGLGFFVSGLYWISFSFLVDAQKFGWMIPIAIFGLSAVFAIYIGLVTLLAYNLSDPGPRRVVYVIIFWVVSEWLRSWLFTGFPWNLLGSVWTFNDKIMQFASVFGVLGLSLLTIGVASAFSFLGYADKSLRFKIIGLSIPVTLLVAIWISGFSRLYDAETKFVDNVLIRIVQPNILQRDKWKAKFRDKHINNLLSLSSVINKYDNSIRPTHIIWPETATPFILDGNDQALKIIAQIIPPKGALLTGSLRRADNRKGTVKLWNSLHVVGSNARILATYDKFHLVPFGEYIPLRKYLDNFVSLIKLTEGRVDFSSGLGRQTISVPGIPPLSPLICYEVIFSGAVISKSEKNIVQPRWLLNITNDAWFGISSGPYQHLAAAQLRAVEEGVPLVRVANTGISAVIDGFGRIQKSSSLNERTFIDSALPKPIENPTIFSEFKILGVSLVVLLLLILSRFRWFS
ncbi:MAG: apolipoprotein N-acyltransferase [Pseudomonadota bacterium]|nr:apolipoprotein N-acyltransferase [Pseudomonadota bacterium]